MEIMFSLSASSLRRARYGVTQLVYCPQPQQDAQNGSVNIH